MPNSRTKGATFEREVARAIYDHLGIEVRRNLDQTRDGGHDLIGLSPFAIECKRYKTATLGIKRQWWKQAVTQAAALDLIPVVIYREDRGELRALMSEGIIFPMDDYRGVCEIGFELWAGIAREYLSQENFKTDLVGSH